MFVVKIDAVDPRFYATFWIWDRKSGEKSRAEILAVYNKATFLAFEGNISVIIEVVHGVTRGNLIFVL